VDEVVARAYIGQYSQEGSFFVAAFQDLRVRLYDVDRDWKLRKDVRTRMCRCGMTAVVGAEWVLQGP
jgi:WD repeat-containing protein 23